MAFGIKCRGVPFANLDLGSFRASHELGGRGSCEFSGTWTLAAFTNQPGNDDVLVRSSSASDTTQTAYVVGISATGVFRTATAVLNGATWVYFAGFDWQTIYEIVLSAPCIGVVTLAREVDGATITTIPAGTLSSMGKFWHGPGETVEVVHFDNQPASDDVLVRSSSGSDTTQTAYVVGISAAGAFRTASAALNGATWVYFAGSDWQTIYEIVLSAPCIGVVTLAREVDGATITTLAPGTLRLIDRHFGGIVEAISSREVVMDSDATTIRYGFTCSDWDQILDRRIAVAEYSSMTVGAIVNSLLDTYIGHSLATPSLLRDGFLRWWGWRDGVNAAIAATVIYSLNASYRRISEVLDDLSRRAACKWWVGMYRELHFELLTALPSPFTITNTAPVKSLAMTHELGEYRNIQYVVYKRIHPATTSETIPSDTRSFQTTFRIYSVASVIALAVTRRVRPSGQTPLTVLVETGDADDFISQPPVYGSKLRIYTDYDTIDTRNKPVLIVGRIAGPDIAAETVYTHMYDSTIPVVTIHTFYTVMAFEIDIYLDGADVFLDYLSNGTPVLIAQLTDPPQSIGGHVPNDTTPYYVKPRAVADDVATAYIGLRYEAGWQLIKLDGSVEVSFPTIAKSILAVYLGEVPLIRTVTVTAPAEFVYEVDRPFVRQDASATPATSIAIVYTGMEDAVEIATDGGDETVAEVQAREGAPSTGKYEFVERPDAPVLEAAAIATAADLGRRYGAFPMTLKFRTFTVGFYVGNALTVTLATFGLSAAAFIVKSMRMIEEIPNAASPFRFAWEIEAVTGEAVYNYVRMYRSMAAKFNQFTAPTNLAT